MDGDISQKKKIMKKLTLLIFNLVIMASMPRSLCNVSHIIYL